MVQESSQSEPGVFSKLWSLMDSWGTGQKVEKPARNIARDALNADAISEDAANRARAASGANPLPSGMSENDVRNVSQGDRGAVRSGTATAAGAFAAVAVATAIEAAKEYGFAKLGEKVAEAASGAGTQLRRIFKRGGPKAAPAANRGLTWTTEATGRSSASKAWEDAVPGASYEVATRRRNVPALRYDNPNPAGSSMVRFDAVDEANPKILIDRKWGVTTKTDQVRKFQDGPLQALQQNPEYRLRIEVPSKKAETDARRLVRYATGSNTHPRIEIVIAPQ
jgi:hypothetical protein